MSLIPSKDECRAARHRHVVSPWQAGKPVVDPSPVDMPRALRVLIFSDSAATLDEIARPLRRSGASVLTAVTASQMRRVLRDACIDVVVCDPEHSAEAKAAAEMHSSVCRCGAGRPAVVPTRASTSARGPQGGNVDAASCGVSTRTAKLVRLAALIRAVALLRYRGT